MTPSALATHAPATPSLVDELRGLVETTLRPLLSRAGPLALLDFPEHGNVGDSAIWSGELAFLRDAGLLPDVVYHCTLSDYDPATLRRRIGRGTLLIHGGGNLGDLWTAHEEFRERVIADFPERLIVQLPQSIHFSDPARLERASLAFARHPALTLLVRDRESLELARGRFTGAQSLLCPDMAYCLGALARPAPPRSELLCLARTDHEALSQSGLSELVAGAGHPSEVCVDWNDAGRTSPVERRHRRFRRRCARWPRLRPLASTWLLRQTEDVARDRVERGCALLGRGARVLTDRLHGHILCELLGLEHALVDTSHGKLSRYHAAWTSRSSIATLCRDASAVTAWLARRPHAES